MRLRPYSVGEYIAMLQQLPQDLLLAHMDSDGYNITYITPGDGPKILTDRPAHLNDVESEVVYPVVVLP